MVANWCRTWSVRDKVLLVYHTVVNMSIQHVMVQDHDQRPVVGGMGKMLKAGEVHFSMVHEAASISILTLDEPELAVAMFL